jgi:putative aldouronate transport system substrate-binding protein
MKHLPKIRLFITTVLLLGILLVQACSAPGSEQATGAPTTAKTATTAPSTATAAPEQSIYNEPGTYPIVKEKQELNIMIPSSTTIADYNTLYSTQYFEELTNVHINWDVVADLSAVKSVILASGDVPDIFANCQINSEEQMIYGGKGLFVDLTPYIDSVGFFIHKMFEYDSAVRPGITAPDGCIYALPTYSKTAHMLNCNKMWVNKVWLDELDLEMPTTLDGFYDMLVDFKTGDPNGNGKPDEIPLSGVGATGWNSCIPYIMSCFIIDDGNAIGRFVQPKGDKADVIFNKEEYREGLRFLAKLYTEGLLDAEAFTQDVALRKQKVSNADGMLVGAASANAPTSFADIDTVSFASYEPLAPLKGPYGVQGTARNSIEAAFVSGHYAVTSKCENPELAFRWADIFYDENNNYQNIFGEEGVHWRYAETGEIGINGLPAIWATITLDAGGAGNVAFNQTVHSFRRAEWRLGEVAAPADMYYLIEGMETRL